MVIKKFKDSHPSVLVVYFLSIIVLLFIQRNYCFILLMSSLAVLMDYFYNKDKFTCNCYACCSFVSSK